jgi:hypothetical protein
MDSRLPRLACISITVLCVLADPAWAQENPAQTVQRAGVAHGVSSGSAETLNSVADGTLTVFLSGGGRTTYAVRLLSKGRMMVHRIITQPGGKLRHGSDGTRRWASVDETFFMEAQGLDRAFIESQTARSVLTFLTSPNLVLRNLGKRNNATVIEAADGNSHTTSYYIDDRTSLVTRFEFSTGQSKDIAGRSMLDVETYVFSDFRSVQGRVVPFKTERYLNSIKSEEVQFSSVSYPTSLSNDLFRP